MSVFSLKIDIADNKFFNGETSPLFSQSQAKLARQFHQLRGVVRFGHHAVPLGPVQLFVCVRVHRWWAWRATRT